MGARSKEPSLLELCLLVGRGSAQVLGGSSSFHRRVGKSLVQDGGIYDMLDYVKHAGVLQKKRSFRAVPEVARRNRRLAVSLDGRATEDTGTGRGGSRHVFNRDAGLVQRGVSARRRHSSFCDVLGPEACEQCRKNSRQNRFVRNARWKVTRSLPDLDHLRAAAADTTTAAEVNTSRSVEAPDIRSSPVRRQHRDSAERRVVFDHNPIAKVGRAQRRRVAENDDTISRTSKDSKGTTSSHPAHELAPLKVKIVQKQKMPPIVKSSGEPQLSHSQLHKRVIDQHRTFSQSKK